MITELFKIFQTSSQHLNGCSTWLEVIQNPIIQGSGGCQYFTYRGVITVYIPFVWILKLILCSEGWGTLYPQNVTSGLKLSLL